MTEQQSEKYIKTLIRKHFGLNPAIKLFTNPCGTGWVGSLVITKSDMVLLKNPRRVDYGLQPGSADLVGWRSLEIKPEHVGKTIAQFLSLEIKTESGAIRSDQQNWHDQVTAAGGVAGIVRNVDEATAVLGVLG